MSIFVSSNVDCQRKNATKNTLPCASLAVTKWYMKALDNRRIKGEYRRVLFPEFAPERQLVGIAKLASEGELLAAKRRVDYRELPTRRFIGRASGRKMPFDWTINPYRGCEFGCKYCYARYTHEFMELRDTEQFETEIYAKRFDAASFRRELARIPRKTGSVSALRPIRISRPSVGFGSHGRFWRPSSTNRAAPSASQRSRIWLPAMPTCSEALQRRTSFTSS